MHACRAKRDALRDVVARAFECAAPSATLPAETALRSPRSSR